jgi:cell division protein FtsQ
MTAPTNTKLGRRILSAAGAVAVGLALAVAGWHGYQFALAQPFKHVVFAGDLDRLRSLDLDALARAVQSADHPDLESVREAARRVPWVRDVSVRRQFPDTVEITFEAYEAFARWNDRELVNRAGEVFAAESPAQLPRLRGPEGSASLVTREFPLVSEVLAPLGIPVTELRLSARGAWEAVLASGLTIELGRGDWNTRARRFAAVYPGLAEEARATRYADLRYPNGFALRRTAEIAPKRK